MSKPMAMNAARSCKCALGVLGPLISNSHVHVTFGTGSNVIGDGIHRANKIAKCATLSVLPKANNAMRRLTATAFHFTLSPPHPEKSPETGEADSHSEHRGTWRTAAVRKKSSQRMDAEETMHGRKRLSSAGDGFESAV